MNDNSLNSPGFPLYQYTDLTQEVFFAYHVTGNELIYLNAAFEKVWNIPRASIFANLLLLIDAVHDDDKKHVGEAFTTLQTARQEQNVEFRIQSPGVKEKWIKVNAYVSEKDNNKTIVGTAKDITAEKDYSGTLHKFLDKKNSILQILSHDLLGPLSNIQLATSLLTEHTNLNEDDWVKKLIDAIVVSSERSVNLIRDLINAEFLQTSESAFVKQRIDLAEKMSDMIDQLQKSPRLLRPRFRLTTSSKKLYISVDESKFMQAINNLLSNALKFTADDGVIEVNMSEPDEKTLLITIQDNGVGIPANMQPFLFDKFTKARRTGIHGEPSTGLGMSIIKTIIEWHNGRIWFESTEGRGTTFYIEMPISS